MAFKLAWVTSSYSGCCWGRFHFRLAGPTTPPSMPAASVPGPYLLGASFSVQLCIFIGFPEHALPLLDELQVKIACLDLLILGWRFIT